ALLGAVLGLFPIACDPGDGEDPTAEELIVDDEEELDEVLVAAAETPDDDDDDSPAADVDLAALRDPLGFVFKPAIGFFTPPSSCDSHQVVTGVTCTGDCSNLAIECHDYGGAAFGTNTWSNFISEELPSNSKECDINQYITGMSCDGWWC